MKIALIDSGSGLDQYLSLMIEARPSCMALEFNSINDFENALKQSNDIGLILLQDSFDDLQNLKKLKQILNQYSHLVLGILSTEEVEKNTALKEFFIQYKQAQFLSMPFDREEFEQFVTSLLKSKKELSQDLGIIETDNFDYKKVKLTHFNFVQPLQFDVYLKLSATNFIKIAKKDDMLLDEFIEKYSQKGVEYLHLKSSDFELFAKYFHQNILHQIQNATSNESGSDLQMMAISNVSNELKGIGFNDHTIQVADQVMKSTLSLLKNNKSIFGFIEGLLKQKNYLAEHSLMIAAISTTIVEKLGWAVSGTNEKLTMAAILHDSLFLDVKLAKVRNLEGSMLSRKEIKEVKNHPIKTSLYLEQMKFNYPDLDTIILQHHERPDGSGFPRGLTSANITALSALFIMTEDLVHELYEEGFTTSKLVKVMKRFEQDYNQGSFKSVLEGFRKTFPV